MLSGSINAFAFDLHRVLIETGDGNLIFSPFSIYVVIAMVEEGARGQTADEITGVLQMNVMDRDAARGALSDLLRRLGRDEDDPSLAERKAQVETLRRELAEQRVTRRGYQGVDDDWRLDDFSEEQRIVRKLNRLLIEVDQYELDIANALFGEERLPFRPDYLEATDSVYQTGGLIRCDFIGNAPAEEARINAWAAERTRGKISQPVPRGSLSALTRLVLVNAVYFKGRWEEQFAEIDTRLGTFHALGDRKTKMLFMNAGMPRRGYAAFNADGSFFETPQEISLDGSTEHGVSGPETTASVIDDEKDGYPDDGGLQVLELPYLGGEISMLVVLPRRAQDLERLEARLTPELVERFIDHLEPRDVYVSLPKFRGQSDFRLEQVLSRMGMPSAFGEPTANSPGADFSGMLDADASEEGLCLGMVVHQAMVDVNEQGTEAAAVTDAEALLFGAMPDTVPFIPDFRANRPFLYLILHRQTKTILFLGRMVQAPDLGDDPSGLTH